MSDDNATSNRKIVVKVRFNTNEYDALCSFAHAKQIPLARFIREQSLNSLENGNRNGNAKPSLDIPLNLLRKIAGIGNNLNQIARNLNLALVDNNKYALDQNLHTNLESLQRDFYEVRTAILEQINLSKKENTDVG